MLFGLVRVTFPNRPSPVAVTCLGHRRGVTVASQAQPLPVRAGRAPRFPGSTVGAAAQLAHGLPGWAQPGMGHDASLSAGAALGGGDGSRLRHIVTADTAAPGAPGARSSCPPPTSFPSLLSPRMARDPMASLATPCVTGRCDLDQAMRVDTSFTCDTAQPGGGTARPRDGVGVRSPLGPGPARRALTWADEPGNSVTGRGRHVAPATGKGSS